MKTVLRSLLLCVLLYSPVHSQSWSQIANFGGSSSYSSFSFAVGNYGYVGTGNTSGSATALTNQMWRYDPNSDTWSQMADVPGLVRYEAVAFAIGNYGYAGTGYNSTSVVVMNDMYKYDPSANSWSTIASIPVARNCAVAFVVGQKAYVATGDTVSNISSYPSTDLWEYDPASDSWTAKTPLPATSRTRAFAFSVAGKGYIGGGQQYSSTNMNDFWQYDPQTDSWSQKSNLPSNVRLAVGFAIGSRGFYCTGYNSNTSANSSQLYEYDPLADSWTAKPNFGGVIRYGAVGFVIGLNAYVGNGRNGSTVYQDWWKYADPELGIGEIPHEAGITIYPNPVITNCSIHIPSENSNELFTFEVYDTNGKCVKKETVPGDFIFSREGLSSAEYLYRISSGKGVISTGRMLVE